MKILITSFKFSFSFFCFFILTQPASAALTLTAGSNATTTPNIATSITGFQIVGPDASTTPVQLRATNGTLSMTTTSGLTFDGASSGSLVNFSGTVANINAALATLKYTRASTGTDTLEVSLVNRGEIFFTDNGHLYKFISGSYTWDAAKTAAEGQTAYGATGYIATITSGAENAFIKDRLTGDGWIGAKDSAVEGDWRWMTGPEAGTLFWRGVSNGTAQGGNYENWADGEPNEYGSGEDCAETYVSTGTWNDFPCNSTLGYVLEFGASGNMPTVVATNISVVTADVPAITTLSPTNGATTTSPTANLVINFSKSVVKQTGNILIRKTVDNSIVETIDAGGTLVSGSGTSAITINPTSDLQEGTQYYITIPATAFKDSSNNFFDGFTSSSTWTFTTTDITAPIISSLSTSTATTSVMISWITNETASTRVWYSADSLFASSTVETDTSTRVMNHNVSIPNLIACTLYNYKAVSRDAFSNTATSTESTFITSGCFGGTVPTMSTSTSVAVGSTATSTLVENNRVLSVQTPANFTATSSSVIIQIKSLNSNTVLDAIGKPTSNLTSAAGVVFDIKALINYTTELDSFNVPVTVSYTYTDADVSGLDESSLSMYHFASSTWSQLDDCSVDLGNNTITCNAPHFSIFAIFGYPPAQQSLPTNASGLPWCSGPSAPGWNTSLPDGGCGATLLSVASASTTSTQMVFISSNSCSRYSFTRTLKFGDRGEDVRALQRLMNCLGFKLADTGPGSSGKETNLFVGLTREAVIAFQERYFTDILSPIQRTKGTGIFANLSQKKASDLSQ